MKKKRVKRCVICGGKFIVFEGRKGRKVGTQYPYPVRSVNCLTCSQDCSKRYSRLNLFERERVKGKIKRKNLLSFKK